MKPNIPSSFIKDNLEKLGIEYKLDNRSQTFQICNPFDDDTGFHMGLNWRLGVYHCFKTSMKGSLYQFFSKMLKLPEEVIEARVRNYYGHDIVQVKKVEDSEIVYHDIPKDWVLVDNKGLYGKMHFRYLMLRQITKEKIERSRFYYTPKDPTRVIIPYFYNKKLVYWINRDITGKSEKRYLYPPSDEWKNKRADLLYNIDNCDKKNLVICEGQFNSIIVDGVAVGGAEISERQLKTMIDIKPEKVILAFDQDVPGKNAILKASKVLYRYFKDLYYIDGPISKRDFSDMGETEAIDFMAQYTKPYTIENIMNTEISLKLEGKK